MAACTAKDPRISVQPAAGDAGGALGAALHVWHHELNNPRKVDGRNDQQAGSISGPLHGRGYRGVPSLERLVASAPAKRRFVDVAGLLAEGKVVGWFSGRMEFGPRALGARSILGDPRSMAAHRQMNLKIVQGELGPSHRRPEDALHDWFDMDGVEDRESFSSPHMLMVGKVTKSTSSNRRWPPVEGFDWCPTRSDRPFCRNACG